ncbi:MAG: DUF2125 domain-containing protein [Alphaproteobacteria bacterium]|nr:DUF2125 domain-containing protein [Alphaproteobacteria bacterium]
MSVPDPAPARKPSRLGLYLPFVLLLILIVAWSALWVWARNQAQVRMDAAVADLTRAGYQVSWRDRQIGGYPFRMDVTLTDAVVRAPSGWALEAPTLEGEAYMHALGHWILAAPNGAAFVRPKAGPVRVTGKAIRAAVFDFSHRPPSFDFEGDGLVFQPEAGAQPFALTGADKVEFHLRAGPDDQGGVFLSVDKGKARPAGLLGRIAGDKPISIVWNSTLSKMSAFTGANWAAAVRHWSDAGGQMSVRQAGLTAGPALIGANSGTLTVGTDGRLRGSLPVTLRQAPQALAAMGQTGAISQQAASAAATVAEARQGSGQQAQATIYFQAGRTTLGPVSLGPAPTVYDVR